MSKPVKAMTCLLFIYNVDLKYLVKQHDRSCEKKLREKVESVLSDAPYNIRRVQKIDHAEYDLFRFNSMKNMVNVLRNVMKSGAHGHVRCSAPPPPL